jgi:hypothetical protein
MLYQALGISSSLRTYLVCLLSGIGCSSLLEIVGIYAYGDYRFGKAMHILYVGYG